MVRRRAQYGPAYGILQERRIPRGALESARRTVVDTQILETLSAGDTRLSAEALEEADTTQLSYKSIVFRPMSE